MDIFTENPMIVIAIIIFVICVIIGFFGDKHFKKKKELEKSLDNTGKVDSNVNEKTIENDVKTASSEENINQQNGDSTVIVDNNTARSQFNETNQNNFVNTAIENSLSNIDTQTQVQNIQQNSSNSIPNNINEPNGNPVPFDGQINNDENINNMF